MEECYYCGELTENHAWIDGVYEPLCFACEEELEDMAEAGVQVPTHPN